MPVGTTKSGGIRCRRSRLAFSACALLLLAACGDDGPTDETADDTDAPTGGSTEPDDALLEDCLLSADEVSDVVGGQVTNEGFSVGGAASGSGGFSADSDSVEVTQDQDYNIGWQSCEYTATDDTTYEVGLLIDEDQQPTVAGFEQLHGYVETATEDQVPPDVGDEGFFNEEEEVVVRSGEVTLVVGFERGSSTGQDEASDQAALETMAGAAIDAGLDDESEACLAAARVTPAEWGELGAPLHGSGAAGSADAPYEYTRCSLRRDDGFTVGLNFGDAEMYDILASEQDEAPPELVTDLGDAAVRADGVLYIRVGEMAAMVSATDAEGEPAEDTNIDALAGVAISALD